MPLPHFLLLILTVILTAALTLGLSYVAGIPQIALALLALCAAALLHLSVRRSRAQGKT